MKFSFTLLTLLLSVFLSKSIACFCLPQPDFCSTVTYESQGVTIDIRNIYYVKVTSKEADGMSVYIYKTYRGEDLTAQTILISDLVTSCSMSTGQFSEGEELIIAADKNGDKWDMTTCGIPYLKVENGKVKGEIAAGVTEIAFEDFPFMFGCGNLMPLIFNEENLDPEFVITPRPNTNQIHIATTALMPGDTKLRVYDAAGRMVQQKTIPREVAASVGENIDTFAWLNGIYFIQLIAANRRETFKFMKIGSR